MVERGRAEGWLPPELDAGRIRRLLRVFAANNRAAMAWKPRPWPGRAVFFRAAQSAAPASAGPAAGWDELADRVEVIEVPGAHGDLLESPHVETLAERLRAALTPASAP